MFDDRQRSGLPAVWRDPGSDQVGDLLPMPSFRSAELVEPVGKATVTADVIVPGLQSAFGGVIVFALGLLWRMHPADAGTLAAVAVLLTWAAVLADTRRLLRRVKRIMGPQPAQAMAADVQTIKLQLDVTEPTDAGGKRVSFVDLPIDAAKMRTFCTGALGGRGLSEGSWIGKGQLLSLAEYRAVRDQLLERGWVRWVSPTAHAQGLELTTAGRAIFRRIVAE